MKVIYHTPQNDIATVYVAKTSNGKLLEFVESTQPPYTCHEKWVLIISTLYGCPVKCPFCDANSFYQGKIREEVLWNQLDYLILRRFPDGCVPVSKFKIQFARTGDPAFNAHVITVLNKLQTRYNAPGLMPSISTIAPLGCDAFFNELLTTKKEKYNKGNFQLQFSIHTTDYALRDKLIPTKKWTFAQIADYGERFYEPDDRKITLNFALAKNSPIDSSLLKNYFSPQKFLIKLTPINPTVHATKNQIKSFIDPFNIEKNKAIVDKLKNSGFDVLLSIGELRENVIGSNCGQYVQHIRNWIPRSSRGMT